MWNKIKQLNTFSVCSREKFKKKRLLMKFEEQKKDGPSNSFLFVLEFHLHKIHEFFSL